MKATFAPVKKLISIFLAMVILSQVFVNVGIGVYYHFNKAFITQKLCENRNNPKVHCNGHCYLSKQLKRAEEGENKSSQLVKEKDEIITNEISLSVLVYVPALSITKVVPENSSLPDSNNSRSLLKPPVV